MTVDAEDVDNSALWSVDIAPRPDARARPDHGAAYLSGMPCRFRVCRQRLTTVLTQS